MSKAFIFIMACLSVTIALGAMIIWSSFDDREEALYQYEILGVKTAEVRENATTGGVPGLDPDSAPDLSLDYADLTPGLQQLLREGKLNPEITVDRFR